MIAAARAGQIAAAIRGFRFRYVREDDLQEGLAEALRSEGFELEREVRLDARNRIDLLVGRVGVEVKVAGRPDAVLRQLERYAESDLVDAIMLVTSRVRHRVPAELNGKPVTVVQLAGWGL